MRQLHNGILLGQKKEENFTLCNSMDEPGEHYAKWNKIVRKSQIPYDFTYMWNLKNKINEQSKNKLRYREQTGGCQTGGGLGKKGEVQIANIIGVVTTV